ncbi:LRR receptor serine/threonine-protein kinase [Salix suchowensis]|nr:LRR receptor serine/threonine-protein kinase [Salix suchowensis]
MPKCKWIKHTSVKGFNLNGVLPEELGDLPQLLEIDLNRNYIRGTIPPRLGQLPKLKILSLIVNRLTGPIPPEIGNITTLEELVLEDNLLGGSLPPDLGNLTSLRRLGLIIQTQMSANRMFILLAQPQVRINLFQRTACCQMVAWTQKKYKWICFRAKLRCSLMEFEETTNSDSFNN